MQLLLVAVVIFVPQTVTAFIEKEKEVDTSKVELNFQNSAESNDSAEEERADPSKLFGDGNGK